MTLVPNETEQALNRQYDAYAAAREEYRKKIAEQASEIERLKAALTPSAKTKAAYIGEFHFTEEGYDEDGQVYYRKVAVPWTIIKEIMAAISARAALDGQPAQPQEPRT